MTKADRDRWNQRYQENDRWQQGHEPFPWLIKQEPHLTGGLAIDLACGSGHNTIWLARRGYRAIGVDGSRVAVQRAYQEARQCGLADRVSFVEADLDRFWLPPQHFDLVVVIRFLNRDLFPPILNTLKPGGLLIYVTLNWRWLDHHPDTDPVYLLQPDELKQAFKELQLISYSEVGDLSRLIARKC